MPLPSAKRVQDRALGPALVEVGGLSDGSAVDVSLQLRAGEILGVAGLVGSGAPGWKATFLQAWHIS